MNIKRIATVVVVIAFWAMPAGAQDPGYDTGDELLARCESDPASATRGVCIGQVVGAMNAIEFTQSIGGPNIICRPPEATNGEGLNVVRAWLRDNSAQRQLESTSVIVLALSEAWPCAGGPVKIDARTGAILLPRE